MIGRLISFHLLNIYAVLMAAGNNNNNNNVWVEKRIMCHSHSYYKQRIKSTIIAYCMCLRFAPFFYCPGLPCVCVLYWIALSDFAKRKHVWIINLKCFVPTVWATLLCLQNRSDRLFTDCTQFHWPNDWSSEFIAGTVHMHLCKLYNFHLLLIFVHRLNMQEPKRHTTHNHINVHSTHQTEIYEQRIHKTKRNQREKKTDSFNRISDLSSKPLTKTSCWTRITIHKMNKNYEFNWKWIVLLVVLCAVRFDSLLL